MISLRKFYSFPVFSPLAKSLCFDHFTSDMPVTRYVAAVRACPAPGPHGPAGPGPLRVRASQLLGPPAPSPGVTVPLTGGPGGPAGRARPGGATKPLGTVIRLRQEPQAAFYTAVSVTVTVTVCCRDKRP